MSENERQRLAESLDESTREVGEEMFRELARAATDFRQDFRQFFIEGRELTAEIRRDYERWQATAPFPGLVRDVYVATWQGPQQVRLQQYSTETGSLVDVRWPAALADMPDQLQRMGREREFEPRLAFDTVWRPWERRVDESRNVESDQDAVWVVLSPQVIRSEDNPGGGRGRNDGYFGWTLLALDVNYLVSDVFPSVIQSQFDPDTFRVGVFQGDRLIYSSDTEATADSFADPDDEGSVLVRVNDRRRRGPGAQFAVGRGPEEDLEVEGRPWEIRVKHQSGSLDQAIQEVRGRNLAVGFGILGLLGVSGGLSIVWTERVRKLGRMQMEFAAGMSHELRTPLATIRAAAHNMAAGLVKDPDQVREYAEMVESEGRRLSSMVDQVIQFAQVESGRRKYARKPVDVSAVVNRAVSTTFAHNEEAREQIYIAVEPDLPPALADETALTHAVSNLLANAAKYGRSALSSFAEISVDVATDSRAGAIVIHVRDRGPGIRPEDLPHVFEPFYRGQNSSSVPGNGLGLHLVRKMVEGQDGSVTVSSTADEGAVFTIRIPASGFDTTPPIPIRD
jgi:signal transduction histidine kinase